MRALSVTFILAVVLWAFAAPVLTGCGEGAVAGSNAGRVESGRREVDADAASGEILLGMVREEVIGILGENYWPDKEMTKEELETETGIGPGLYTACLAEEQKVETDIDRMILIKARPECLTEIETLLNAYRDSLLVKYKERPQELGKALASRIEIIDQYVCFVQLGADTAKAAQEGDEQVIAQCQQENERAVDMIERTIFEALLRQREE
jgi:hypothetical protein